MTPNDCTVRSTCHFSRAGSDDVCIKRTGPRSASGQSQPDEFEFGSRRQLESLTSNTMATLVAGRWR